jgi:hypothetical protein
VPVEKVYGTNTLRGLECHCSPRQTQEIGRRRCRIMDSVNRGGCAKEGARVFRAGAPAQVIRDRGGADDEQLIVQQAGKPPQLLVALAKASALTMSLVGSRAGERWHREEDVGKEQELLSTGRSALHQKDNRSLLEMQTRRNWKGERDPHQCHCFWTLRLQSPTHRPNSRARDCLRNGRSICLPTVRSSARGQTSQAHIETLFCFLPTSTFLFSTTEPHHLMRSYEHLPHLPRNSR